MTAPLPLPTTAAPDEGILITCPSSSVVCPWRTVADEPPAATTIAAFDAFNTVKAEEATGASSEIIVTGSVYRGEVASGGARIDADVRDLPLAISVVTEQLIDDRQVRNLKDLKSAVPVEMQVRCPGWN